MLLKKPAQHIIFDLDGVLFDTERLYTIATKQALLPYGKHFDWSLKAQMMGRDSRDAAALLVNALDLPISAEEFLAQRTPILEQLLARAEPLPGAPGFVQELSELGQRFGMQLAIATSGSAQLTALKLKGQAWAQRFNQIICGDDPALKRPKPAPDIFLLAAKRLGVEPSACLVFEDSLAGVEAAISAGMQVIALLAPEQLAERFKLASHIIYGYSELNPKAIGLGPAT